MEFVRVDNKAVIKSRVIGVEYVYSVLDRMYVIMIEIDTVGNTKIFKYVKTKEQAERVLNSLIGV